MSEPSDKKTELPETTLVDGDTGEAPVPAGPETTLVDPELTEGPAPAPEPKTRAPSTTVDDGPTAPAAVAAPPLAPARRPTREAVPAARRPPTRELPKAKEAAARPPPLADKEGGVVPADPGPEKSFSTTRFAELKRAVSEPAVALRIAKWAGLSLAAVALVLMAWWLTPTTSRATSEVSDLRPIPRPPPPPRPRVVAPPPPVVVEAPKPDVVWLKEVVDAGEGYTRTEQRAGCMMGLSSDPGAQVSIDGGVIGTTPFLITLPVGEAVATFENRKLGLRKTVSFNVPAAQQATRSFKFQRGWLDVDAPDGSKVSIDGRAVGTSPLKPIELFEGQHTIDVVPVGGKRQSGTAEVLANQTVTHFVSAPKPAE